MPYRGAPSKLSPVTETTDFLRANPVGHTEFLVGKAKAGSDTAWREILRRYRTMLVFHVRARIHGITIQDLEELLARVLSKVVAHIQGFEYRGEGSFRRWLAALVVNECRDEMEERATRNTETRELSEVADEAGAHSQALTAECEALVDKLGELDPYDRDLLIMRYFEKMSWGAIAEVLDCSLEKVQGDYALAFERLSRRLGA